MMNSAGVSERQVPAVAEFVFLGGSGRGNSTYAVSRTCTAVVQQQYSSSNTTLQRSSRCENDTERMQKKYIFELGGRGLFGGPAKVPAAFLAL